MDSQVFGCPACQQPFQVTPDQAGQVVQCPSCSQQVQIPIDAFSPAVPTQQPQVEQAQKEDPIVMSCSSCEGQFGVTRDMFGQSVACPHCGQINEVVIPTQTASESPDSNVVIQPTSKTRKKKQTTPKPSSNEDLFAPGHGKKEKANRQVPDPQKKRKSNHKDSAAKLKPTRRSKSQPNNSSTDDSPKSSSPEKSEPAVLAKGENRSNPGDLIPPKRQSETFDLLPPSFSASDPDAESAGPQGLKQDAAVDTKSGSENPTPPQDSLVEELLPPKFLVADPFRVSVADRNNSQVILPDGRGGTKTVDQRVLRVEHEGQLVSLVALSPRQRLRRRIISNVVAIVVGITIIAIVFSMLTSN